MRLAKLTLLFVVGLTALLTIAATTYETTQQLRTPLPEVNCNENLGLSAFIVCCRFANTPTAVLR